MENDVRRYITRILALNLAFLLAIGAVVALAGQSVYRSAQDQAEAASLERLRQPANQAADAIGRHFAGIFATLDVDLPSINADAAAPQPATSSENDVLVAALWVQLRSRISDLLVVEFPEEGPPIIVNRFANQPSGDGENPFPEDMESVIADDEAAARLVTTSEKWLQGVRQSGTPSLSDPSYPLDGIGSSVLTAVVWNDAPPTPTPTPTPTNSTTPSAPGRPSQVLVGLVPLDYIETSFVLSQLQPKRLGLLIVDSRARVVAGVGDPAMHGVPASRLAVQGQIPLSLSRFILERVRGGSAAPGPFFGPVRLGTLEFDETLSLMTPVPMLGRPSTADAGTAANTNIDSFDLDDADDAQVEDEAATAALPLSRTGQLWVVALLNREEVVKPLEEMSRTALLWAMALIVAVTAILVSSSYQLIRARGQFERLRTEMVDKELRDARSIQLRWLPEDEAKLSGVREIEIAARNVPASHISGDFYNYFKLPSGDSDDGSAWALAIGDVTGHGIAAAFLMSTTQLLIQTSLERTNNPATTLAEVNNLLSRQATGGQFVTLLLAMLDSSGQRLSLASAGHAGPLACDENGTWSELTVDGDLVLGVLAESDYTAHDVALNGSRALLFYTDGAVEVVNQDEERFDLGRLAEGLRIEMPAGPDSAKDVVDAALRVVRGFAGGAAFGDDVTLLAVYFEPIGESSPEFATTSPSNTRTAS